MLLRKLNRRLEGILPNRLRYVLIRQLSRAAGLERDFKNMPLAEIFDRIYENGVWGRDASGLGTSGTGSHKEQVVEIYIQALIGFLEKLKEPSIVDLGCGDFAVGSRLVKHSSRYTACDISERIIGRNKKIYSSEKVAFVRLDIASDELPVGDVGVVRQVLQHLDNANISRFIERINEDRPFKYLIVTEHVPDNGYFTPNRDKPAGAETRVRINSGIDLTSPPFSLRYKDKIMMCEVEESDFGFGAVIRTVLYRL